MKRYAVLNTCMLWQSFEHRELAINLDVKTQAAVMLVMLLWLGGPLFCFFLPCLLFLFGSTTQLCYFFAIFAVLASHPVPNMEHKLNKSAFSMWMCKLPSCSFPLAPLAAGNSGFKPCLSLNVFEP